LFYDEIRLKKSFSHILSRILYIQYIRKQQPLGVKILEYRVRSFLKNTKVLKNQFVLWLNFWNKTEQDSDFLEHIFKKMGSTEIVMSSVRPSVRLSVCHIFLGRYST
jgi:hypothetical protein